MGPRYSAFLLPLATGLVVAGCTSEAARPQPQGDPIVIGAPLALTGSLSGEGQMAQEGYYFCRNWVNAKGGVYLRGTWHPLMVDVQDDQSRASVSAQVTERLISQDHVRLLLGPVGNLAADRDAAVAEAHQVPILLGSSAESTFNRQFQYVFGVASPASHYLQGVVDMALSLTPAPQSAAILFARDAFSTEIANDLNAYVATKGLSVVYFDSFPGGTNDLRGKLGAIAATAPDLVLGVGGPSDTVVTMEAARLNPVGGGRSSADRILPRRQDLRGTVPGGLWAPSGPVQRGRHGRLPGPGGGDGARRNHRATGGALGPGRPGPPDVLRRDPLR